MNELLMLYSAICYLMFIGIAIEETDIVKQRAFGSFILFLFSPAVIPIIIGMIVSQLVNTLNNK